jgi:hypothetical protein
MAGILARLFGKAGQSDASEQKIVRTAEVFTTAIPTVSYVTRSAFESELKQELEKRDKVICITGPSKSGKTVVVRKLIPNAPLVIGQVGLEQREIWRHLCSVHNISLKRTDEIKGTGELHAGPIGGKLTVSAESDTHIDARNAFLRHIKSEQAIIFDDFHYFEPETQKEILQGLKPLLLERVTIVLVSTSYGEDQPILAEPDMLARIRFVKVPVWSDDDLEEILRKGLSALNVSASASTIRGIARGSYGSPLIVQELGAYLCYSNEIRERAATEKSVAVPDVSDLVKRAVQQGSLAADKPTFMRLIIGRTPPTGRSEYQVAGGGKGDVYYLIFNALRALDLSTPIPHDAINKWIRDNLPNGERPQGGQITTALEGLKKTSRELVKEAQEQNRSRELPIESRGDVRTLYVNDPFLKLYIKFANWDEEYKARLGQLRKASGKV